MGWEVVDRYSLNVGALGGGNIWLYTAGGTRNIRPANQDGYQALIDVLRNEKPVHAYVNAENNVVSLSTSREPTGEGET